MDSGTGSGLEAGWACACRATFARKTSAKILGITRTTLLGLIRRNTSESTGWESRRDSPSACRCRNAADQWHTATGCSVFHAGGASVARGRSPKAITAGTVPRKAEPSYNPACRFAASVNTRDGFKRRLSSRALRRDAITRAGGRCARCEERPPSRLLKNTRIGLFSWPSCVSRPPRQRCARGHAVPTRGPATPAAGDQGHLASRFRNRTNQLPPPEGAV